MEQKKEPLQNRLKKDLAIFVIALILVGGPLAGYINRSPYVGYLLLGAVVITFGPYVVEYTKEKLNKKELKEDKMLVSGIEQNDKKEIYIEKKVA